jgi:2-polyprenyl-6-methoxyphenol hydroxylase-like FAD-dependent oxidoreductase
VLADHYAGVLHPGDNDTFSVALGTLAGDAELRGLRDPGAFDAAARATPWVAQWMDDAMPITDVRVTTSPANILRAMGTTPGFTGPLPVGDAACTTDPMYGRGVGLALAHGFGLAALLRSCAPGELGHAAAGLAADLFLPWFQQARVETQDRVERWRAAVAGVAGPSRPVSALRAAGAAATLDPQVWRGLVRVLMGLRTPDTLTDEPFVRRVRDALASGTPAAPPGLPGRAELVAIVREGAGAGEGRERDHARRGAR